MTTASKVSPRVASLTVVERLRESGYQALWAGGCVRDLLLGKEPKDYDVATNATPRQVRGLFRRTVAVGESFGVVIVIDPSGQDTEVATFRTDDQYVDGRRPVSVQFSTPQMDAQRRDFTINGMFLDPITDEILDYVEGKRDLDLRLLRAIGEPRQRFSEDKLRLLRAARFASTLGFDIEPETEEAAIAMADQIVVVSAERIKVELENMLTAPSRRDALKQLQKLGLLLPIFGELASGILETSAWDLTARVLGSLGERISFSLALAGLLASRPDTTAAADAESLCLALKCSNEERERAVWLVKHRHDLDDAPSRPLSFLKRLWAQPGAEELLLYSEALAKALTGKSEGVPYCRALLGDLADDEIRPPPLVNGNDLISAGLKPGPRFQTLLERIRDAQLDGEVTTHEQALALLKKIVEEKVS